jgi:penicillin-binding protein 1A
MVSTMTRAGGRPATPPARRSGRRRSWAARLARLVVSVALLGALLLVAGWELTPSVDDATARVAGQLSAHSGPALQGPVPTRVADALIATENSRFYSSPGLDPVSVLRAPVGVLSGKDPGGATLEQQLAKNLYEQGSMSLLARAAEGVLALKLDRTWSKAQILRMYLDDGYYGNGFYGLTAASRGYFGMAPAKLSWAQASLLAGLFQAPSAYNPLAHPAAARARQAHVLDRLVAVGALTRAQADSVGRESWGLRTAG